VRTRYFSSGGGDQGHEHALAELAGQGGLAAVGVDHVVAAVVAADHGVSAVGGGQQVVGPDAHACKARVERQAGKSPVVFLSADPFLLDRVDQA
jgi:hypothetical protein